MNDKMIDEVEKLRNKMTLINAKTLADKTGVDVRRIYKFKARLVNALNHDEAVKIENVLQQYFSE